MTDPLHEPAAAALPVAADAASTAGAALPTGGDGPALALGRRWRNFQIEAADPVHGPGAYRAIDAGTMEEVIVTCFPPAAAATRVETWRVFETLPAGNLLPLREATEEGGWRYEVTGAPPGTPLREWIACHQVGLAEIESIMRQLTLLLEAMHAAGVVHLRIRPDTIFVNEAERNLEVMLGGLALATLHTQPDLVPVEVDPYYGPPEAAGLFRHKPGPELCAWDWWSLGRVVQEIVLGKHVYSLLFERDIAGNPPELKARAEAALLDRDPSGVRAGAVELLPDHVAPRLRTLLRGLLASSRDGRWGSEQVLLWLQREPTAERYDLPRDARLFVWRRRAFTLPEAAEFFSQPDYALEGQAQLFPGHEPEGTLRAFLAELPQFRAEFEHVEKVLALIENAPWQALPLPARRAAVTGLAWLTLAPASARPALQVARWRVDAPGMQEMLSDAPPSESVAFVRVMATPVYRRAVETLDAHAGRTLGVLTDAGLRALETAEKAGWVAANDHDACSRVLRFSLDAEKDLLARRERLRTAYATNRDPQLAALLAREKPDRPALVLLAFTGERARDFGYVTHADWAQARFEELRARGAAVATALFWRGLLRVVVSSPALLGPWPIFAALWSLPLALCVAGEAWFWGVAIAGSAAALRWAAQARLNALRSIFAPGSAPWTWSTRPQRCADEEARALARLAPKMPDSLPAEFARVGEEIRALKLKPAPAPPQRAPRFVGFWAASVASLAAPGLLALALFVAAGTVPPTPALVERPKTNAPDVSATAAELAEASRIFEEFNDGFGRRPRGPLRAWDVPSVAPRPLAVRRMAVATPVQRAYAKVGAELLLDPYPRRNLEVTVAVPVPVEDGAGLLLYDSVARELVDPRTFFVAGELADRTWYWIGNRRVVFLGVPERLRVQNSLAPP